MGHGEKWIARKHHQVLDLPQPMTAMTQKKFQVRLAISTAPDVMHNHTCTNTHSITVGGRDVDCGWTLPVRKEQASEQA